MRARFIPGYAPFLACGMRIRTLGFQAPEGLSEGSRWWSEAGTTGIFIKR
jgi:hypothetical protein